MINETHDPQRRSWVASANEPGHDFPLQNLPLGMFSTGQGQPRPGVAIGDQILDLLACVDLGLLDEPSLVNVLQACTDGLNPLMAAGKSMSQRLRLAVFHLLDEGIIAAGGDGAWRSQVLVAAAQARMHLPCQIGDYTDFLTSLWHTERHGRFKGLADPLPKAFKHLPVAYHGRASSIGISGQDVQRPHGQWLDAQSGQVCFGPAQAMDFETEFAAFIGQGNDLGQPVALDEADRHLFGYCLLNDWSSKQVQWWEQVLGPFLGKSFGTTISPWVVTDEALAPFRQPSPAREPGDPTEQPYLRSPQHSRQGGLRLALQAALSTEAMRLVGGEPEIIVRTELGHLYWTVPQMLTHHASNGCNLRPGDLLGTGTVSGPDPLSMACLTEKTEAGRVPFRLSNGEERLWLADGDEIILSARAEREGFVSIGFGACRARLLPARQGV